MKSVSILSQVARKERGTANSGQKERCAGERRGGERGWRGGREGRERAKVRAKPGAALAGAQREAVGIVPSQGKKIVF